MSEVYFNINSTTQLQEFLYEHLGLPPQKQTKSGKSVSVDEDSLTYFATKENNEFCKLLLQYRKLEKARNTYLNGFIQNREKNFWILHPNFWLNTTVTYRPSSSDPNFQNQPKHGNLIPGIPWTLLRRVVVKKALMWLIGEADYDQAEVKTSAMLSNDQQLIDDCNSKFDMHSHWASVLFGIKGMTLKELKVRHENERYLAKNTFTFANFYGAAPPSIAEEMRKFDFYKDYVYNNFYRPMARPIDWDKFYLDFSIEHITKCQNEFYSRYRGVKAWQDWVVDFYYKNHYIENGFGFRRRYPMKRNEIINTPIQGTSFLLLQDSINQIEDYLEKENPENLVSRPIGQIHDALVNNVFNPEAGEYIEMVDHFMCDKPHLEFTKKVKMGTDWSFGHNWQEMHHISY